jgi:exodeoxyribonuclease-3
MLNPLRALALLLIAVGVLPKCALAAEPAIIRVFSFNLWHGGDAGKQPLERTIAVIKDSKADIVGLQETAGYGPAGASRPDRAAEIAKALGWHYLDQGGRTGIVSRFPIVNATPRKWGAQLQLPSGRKLYHFNAHLAHAPYQPYQLLRIPYHNGEFLTSAEQAVKAAEKARGVQVERLLSEVKAIQAEGTPIFITGDFNEPSHLDWTAAAAAVKLCPLEVAWPSTRQVVAAGFVDAYRSVHPDPVQHRGVTWTPITKPTDPKDRHDRIDLVFAGGAKVKVKNAQVVGESPETAEIVVRPYPSDHRAVVAEIEIGE